ncbi:type II toxin-antitoxin system HicB family antitoxin [Candidatus Palauibacter sp.]|uniref:type II toxin-antitoxin system HicB family antitoxin n=1 Tax=Candidatus Palauibacter sp. TaxID=3101350 RepID=UPI003B02321B
MYKYEIILFWSNEDQGVVAEAPELPGCMAHGDDHESALSNIKDAMRLWIDRARELGRPVPEPKGKRLMPA